jgi:hypothetical protein
VDSKEALFRLLVWFLYFNGVGVHILISARASIAAKSNSIVTMRSWWEYNWHTLGFRLFLDSVFLMGWEVSPQVVGQVLGHVLPVTLGTAAFMGIAVDRMIGGIGFSFGWLGADMPKVAPSEHP